jgi:Zn-dependent protease with chaperone function
VSFQYPGFDAYICHPQFGSELARGQLIVTQSALRFTATEPPFELPLDDAVIEIGDDADWISLRDQRQPDLRFFVDRAILDNGFFLKSGSVRRQVEAQLGRRERRRNFALMVTGLVAVVAIAWVASRVLHWGVRLAVRGITAKQEIEFGDRVFAKMQSRLEVIEDTNAVAQLDSLMAALSPAVHARVPFKFSIAAGPPNSFALPGGRIVVTTGLLKLVDTPEQLLGVLAHESAHIAQRHSFQHTISGGGPIFLMEVLAGGGDKTANLMALPSELLIYESFSQEYETEADACGWDYLVAAHINPHGEIEALQKLRERERGTLGMEQASAFDSHPDLDRRIRFLESRWSKLTDTNHFVVFNQAPPKVDADEQRPSRLRFGR